MFAPNQYGKLNADRVGEFGPECLLVTGAGSAKSDPRGFNHVADPFGNYYRAVNMRTGAGIFPLVAVAESDLAGVSVEPFRRPELPGVPPFAFAPEPREFCFECEAFVIEGEDRVRVTGRVVYRAVPDAGADSPLIVEAAQQPTVEVSFADPCQ